MISLLLHMQQTLHYRGVSLCVSSPTSAMAPQLGDGQWEQ
jgi:hypothetical protein